MEKNSNTNTNEAILLFYQANGFNGKSETTKKTYIKEIELLAEWLKGVGTDLAGFARVDIQQYIDFHVSREKKAATILKKWNAIVHFCRFMKKEHAIENIRVLKGQNQLEEAPKALSRVEQNRMLREVSRSQNLRDIAIITTLLYTGMRVSELVALDRTSIDFSEKKGFIRVIGKGNKERIVPANNEVRHAINNYLSSRSDQEPALFLSNYHKRISVRSVQRIVRLYGNCHPHALRHTFATNLLREKGADPSMVAYLLGQSGLQMVMRYTKASFDQMWDKVESLTF